MGDGSVSLGYSGGLATARTSRILLPKRWVVERTFGWLSWCRRLSRDHEGLPETSEMWIYIAMIRIMVRRLA